MSHPPIKQKAKQELISAIKYFLTRQHLVAHALKDLGIHLDDLAMYGPAAWVAAPQEKTQLLWEQVRATQDYEAHGLYYITRRVQSKNISQSGTWHDINDIAWAYYLHGKGCQLINTVTGEIIDWNSPYLDRFNTYFFIEHLKWQLQNAAFQDALLHLNALTNHNVEQTALVLLNELTEEGELSKYNEIVTNKQQATGM